MEERNIERKNKANEAYNAYLRATVDRVNAENNEEEALFNALWAASTYINPEGNLYMSMKLSDPIEVDSFDYDKKYLVEAIMLTKGYDDEDDYGNIVLVDDEIAYKVGDRSIDGTDVCPAGNRKIIEYIISTIDDEHKNAPYVGVAN